MTKGYRISLLALAVLALGCTVWFIATPNRASAQVGAQPAAGAPRSESWTLGVTVQGPPTYSAVVGRLVSSAAVYRTNGNAGEAATIFPASAGARTVQSARVLVVSQTGQYNGTVTLLLRIYDLAGNLQRNVSVNKIDLASVPLNTWISFPLSTVTSDLVIQPGEFLACSVTYSAGAGGNLDIRSIYEIVVR
ncbi:MAG: hypothetical protein ACYC5M_13870 [Anaerolineae bacterium]